MLMSIRRHDMDQEMVWLIGNDLDYAGAKVNLPERFPFIE